MRRILVICLGHIGDALLITPALELLSRFFPDAEISVVVRKGTEAVLENNPFIKTTYIYGEITSNQQMHRRTKSSLGRRLGQIPQGLRLIQQLRRQHFDLAMDLNGGDRAAIMTFLSGAKDRVGYQPAGGFKGKSRAYTQTFARPSGPRHRVLYATDLVFQFAASRPQSTADQFEVGPLVLRPTAENSAWADIEWKIHPTDARPRVLLHPTSRVAYKCWAPAKWAQVIERLQKTFNARLMLTCSPDPKEMKMAEAIRDLCAAKPEVRLGNLSLGQLAALIQRADLFLGVDSAPMHMAAAVGTPVIAVFGPSDDLSWSPWGKKNRVVRRPCPCLDSKKALCSAEQGMDCLNGVPAEDVWQAASEILSARLIQPPNSFATNQLS
jgi:heptosyltransferase-3